jgi:pyruvate dehydrogenase phosphatase
MLYNILWTLQANKPIEDSSAVGRLAHDSGSLFGVYDGHGGRACSQAISERLFSYIAVALADHRVLKACCFIY